MTRSLLGIMSRQLLPSSDGCLVGVCGDGERRFVPVQVSARLRDALPGGPDIVIDCAGFEATLLACHNFIFTASGAKAVGHEIGHGASICQD